jgi:hypothetical protein
MENVGRSEIGDVLLSSEGAGCVDRFVGFVDVVVEIRCHEVGLVSVFIVSRMHIVQLGVFFFG